MAAAIIVMGVSGSGKTIVGRGLADVLGWNFKDADDLHPKENVAKMSKGIPLTDGDRLPWLTAVNQICRETPHVVVACSALKYQYRERLRNGIICRFIFLNVSKETLGKRLTSRTNHFMPSSLLESQLNTLETPAEEENILTINCDNLDVQDIVKEAVNWLALKI